MNYTTFQTREGFIHELVEAIVSSTDDLDLSIILESVEAEYMLELIENSEKVMLTPNNFDHDFDTLTGDCLVTVVKEDMFVSVIVEDYCYQNKDGSIQVKNHETDIYIVFDGEVDVLEGACESNKVINVVFKKESELISKIIF